MRTAFLSAATLALSGGVSALPQAVPQPSAAAPALPIADFEKTPKFTVPLMPDDILSGLFKDRLAALPIPIVSGAGTGAVNRLLSFMSGGLSSSSSGSQTTSTNANNANNANTPAAPAAPAANDNVTVAADNFSAAATCSNPRIRQEWDSYSNSDKQAFISAVRCLQNRSPSGQFGRSRSRYEDLVALHQTLTPNVHGNAKFLVWHRYYLWTFEDILRSECGFDRNLPWWDETRYAGRYTQSSVFSSQWFGSVNVGGNCVTDGQFANLPINIGPGTDNVPHCLSRNNDDSRTQYTSNEVVDGCNNQGSYSDMASCSEGGAHAWGHNGIGAVMQDTFASPADPVFWLHHAFIDRNFRIWQNRDSSRLTNINGNDAAGNALTLDTTVNVYDMRPTVQIRDILDTMSDKLCYKYNY